MSKLVWICEYCEVEIPYGRGGDMKEHERHCSLNPKTKSCARCKNHRKKCPYRDGYGKSNCAHFQLLEASE